MVTPELLEYVRVEISKGKTREEINKALISGGGWNETDLNEAFRILIPMQSAVVPVQILPVVEPERSASASDSSISVAGSPKIKFKAPWHDLVFIVLGLLCVISWYFYQPQIVDFWNRGVKNSQEFSVNSWNSYTNIFKEISFPVLVLPSFEFKLPTLGSQPFEFLSLSLPSFDFKFPSVDFGSIFYAQKTQLVNNIVASIPEEIIRIKNCGINVSPKLDTSSLNLNDPVLACLGESAVNCENAQAILRDDFFPTIFEIVKLPNACNFKLSYEIDSSLTDITGKKLALQYISCPLSIVKTIDNSQPDAPQFFTVDKKDFSKYASQIYFYGILGLFVENKLDKNKIQTLGCSGDYIDSVIASYQQTQSK